MKIKNYWMQVMKYIADISSNHCGNLEIAKLHIREAKKHGADYAKFQYWETDKFISDDRFKFLKVSHQADWTESVYQTYKKYEIPKEWIPELYKECNKEGVEFLLSCYELSKIDEFDQYVNTWKIGSGDITYTPMLEKIASKGKPVILGCGASTKDEIITACNYFKQVIPLKCNTDYTGNDIINMKYLNYGLLKNLYKGISDHTKSDIPIVIAVCYGAEYIERHFKVFDNDSPDSKFSMNPKEWSNMVSVVEQTKKAIESDEGVQGNETLTRVIQRRNKNDWKRPDIKNYYDDIL